MVNLRSEAYFTALKRDIAYLGDVSSAVEEKVVPGLNSAFAFIGKTPGDPVTGGNLAAGRALSKNTLLTYEHHFRGLINFFKIIGDYQSLLMLRDRRPLNCPSMNVESLIMYLRWKFGPKTMPLTNLEGVPMKDVVHNPILCTGIW